MVRRRARTTKQATAATLSVVSNNLLEEQFFASPKRKDCKIENNSISKHDEFSPKIKGPSNSHKTKTERTIEVPLATRSQKSTIEKTETAKENDMKLVNTTEEAFQIMSPQLPCTALHIVSELTNDLVSQQTEQQSEYIFEISDDETNNTESSDEASAICMGPRCDEVELIAHQHASLENVYTSRNNTNITENIFLQEPVLTLNVDKTLNQASSIKINKSIEVEPVFSSPPSLATTSLLHGCFNKIDTFNGIHGFSASTEPVGLLPTPKLNGFVQLPENDNNSCDSGVGFVGSMENNHFNKSNINLLTTIPFANSDDAGVSSPIQIATRRRKPATPHRILCPSPTKIAARVNSNSNDRVLSPSAPTHKQETSILSPRKSPRHYPIVATVASKTRRRLNPQQQTQQKDKAPYKNETTKTVVQNGYKQQNEDGNIVHDDKNFQKTTAPENKTTKQITKTITGAKTVTNDTKSKNILPSKLKAGGIIKKLQTLQPLTSTNTGNRELTEFFPVRRSVRKTKTVVKEEMMRSLEQAVLEERADGLKVEHFEGKGRGVVAERRFQRGEFVVEYVGDLISMNEAMEREKRYALDENAGCYMYYFKHKNQQYCIDATVDTGKLGRLVNHSRNGNLLTKVVVVKQRPHLVLLAKDVILPGEELTYDYGDRSKESLIHHPWLAF